MKVLLRVLSDRLSPLRNFFIYNPSRELKMISKYAKVLVAANLVVPVGAAIAADHRNKVVAVCTVNTTVDVDFQVRNAVGVVNGDVRIRMGRPIAPKEHPGTTVDSVNGVRADYTAPKHRDSDIAPGAKRGEQHIYTHMQEVRGGGKVQSTFVNGRNPVEERTLDQFAKAGAALISEGKQVAQLVCQGDRSGGRKPIDLETDPRAQWLNRRIVETVFSIQ
jgi:hypothetical protein